LVLTIAVSAGCAQDSLHGGGSGGSSQSGGTSGTGGLSQSGGAPGTGGSGVDAEVPGNLAAAEATWAATKASCSAYTYERQDSSTGYCGTTVIDIKNDQPAARYFTSARSACSDVDAGVTEQWQEIGADQIGTHADGFPAWTVEQIFSYCQTILAMNSGGNQIRFSVNSEGVPTTCTTTVNSCVDDCSRTCTGVCDCNASCTSGIQLSSFVCQPPPG
jgi:hypothetical protein